MKIALRIRKGVLSLSAAFLSLASVVRACQIASAGSSIIVSSFRLQWCELASLPLLARDQLTQNEPMPQYKPLPQLERLNELFEVNSDGRLLCRTRPHAHSRSKVGDEVGTLHPSGYRKVAVDGTAYFVHRIVWFLIHGEDPGQMQIDHINRIRDDNRIENLRLATSQQNKWNRGPLPASRSGYRGIRKRFWGRSYRWEVSFKNKYVGTYKSLEEAIDAWESAAKPYAGEFFCPPQKP